MSKDNKRSERTLRTGWGPWEPEPQRRVLGPSGRGREKEPNKIRLQSNESNRPTKGRPSNWVSLDSSSTDNNDDAKLLSLDCSSKMHFFRFNVAK